MFLLKTVLCLIVLTLTPFSFALASENSYEPDTKLMEYKNEISYQLNRAIENNYPVKVEAYQKQLDDIELRLKEDKRQWQNKRKETRLEEQKSRKEAMYQKRYDRIYNKTMQDFADADRKKERLAKTEARKTKQLENKKKIKEKKLKDKEEKEKKEKQKK